MKRGFDFLADPVIITDTESHVLYANKAVEDCTGFFIPEIIGKKPRELWGGYMPSEFYERMWRTIKTEKRPFTGEVKNKKKDGTFYWQELHISPVLDAAGEVRLFIGIESDISDRKEREKFKDEFISVLAHQLRNPLTANRWTLQLLFRMGGLNKEQLDYLQDVYKTTEYLLFLITDLLTIVQVGKGTEYAPTDIYLEQEIAEVIESVQKRNKDVRLSFIKKEKTFPFRARKVLSDQVFANLIDNAVEYCDPKNQRVEIVLRREKGAYIFSCENNGLSISAEDQPKIFGGIFRSENAVARKPYGTGIGLFICKLLCDKLGWRIYFKSPCKDGNGAVFFVEIPLDPVQKSK